MAKISKDEVLKIAYISHLDIHEDEIAPLIKQIDDVLTYAGRVKEIVADTQEPPTKNANVFREDVVIKFNADLLLSRAPEREGNFFVVPAILENAK